MIHPGSVTLFGSGETSASGRRIFHHLFEEIDAPIRGAILETPAGFEPNSQWVAAQVADFLHKRLQNFSPKIEILPLRRRDGEYSTNSQVQTAPVREANLIYMGAGSPTYAVRHLQNTLAWQRLVASHRRGATLVFASASTLALGSQTLPVYEIYKAGADLHWKPGLNFFDAYGLDLVFIPHWNNRDGGEHLDTHRCYMGEARFDRLYELLPSAKPVIVGLDEHTALTVDFDNRCCRVMGNGSVTLLREGCSTCYKNGADFDIEELGLFCLPEPTADLPEEVWADLQAGRSQKNAQGDLLMPPTIVTLADARQAARANRDWALADQLRDQIIALDWDIRDTRAGYDLVPLAEK